MDKLDFTDLSRSKWFSIPEKMLFTIRREVLLPPPPHENIKRKTILDNLGKLRTNNVIVKYKTLSQQTSQSPFSIYYKQREQGLFIQTVMKYLYLQSLQFSLQIFCCYNYFYLPLNRCGILTVSPPIPRLVIITYSYEPIC